MSEQSHEPTESEALAYDVEVDARVREAVNAATRELGRIKGREFGESVGRLKALMAGVVEGLREAEDPLARREGEEWYLTVIGEAWEAAHAEVPLRAIIAHIDHDDHGNRAEDVASLVWLGGKRLDVARGEWWPAYVELDSEVEEIGFITRDGDAFVPHAARSWGHQRLGRVHGKYFALEALRREAGR